MPFLILATMVAFVLLTVVKTGKAVLSHYVFIVRFLFYYHLYMFEKLCRRLPGFIHLDHFFYPVYRKWNKLSGALLVGKPHHASENICFLMECFSFFRLQQYIGLRKIPDGIQVTVEL